MFSNGADSRHVADTVVNVASDLGQEAHVLVTSDAILATVGTSEHFSTKVGHQLTSPTVNMGHLSTLRAIIDQIHAGTLGPFEADQRLDALETSGGRYPIIAVVLGLAITTASLARLFGATWTVVMAALVAGAISAVLRRQVPKISGNQFASTFIIAILSGLAAVCALSAYPDASPVLALTAAGMVLVPGVPLINGIRDISGGYAGNGVARLVTGTVTVLVIGFALFTVGLLTGAELPVGTGPGSLPLTEDLVFSGLAAFGFALLFNVPPRAIFICILTGIAGHGLRSALEQVAVNLPLSSLIGAFAAGLIARAAASAYRSPAVVFAFPGVVALIPGSYGFRAGIGGLQIMAEGAAASHALIATTIALAITTTVTTIAIALGVTLSLAGSHQNLLKLEPKDRSNA